MRSAARSVVGRTLLILALAPVAPGAGATIGARAEATAGAPGDAAGDVRPEATAAARGDAIVGAGGEGARLLVVSGIGGEETFSEAFRSWALQMLDAAADPLGLAPAQVTWLCETPARDPGRCAGQSRRETVLDTVARLLRTEPAHAPVLILLLGHGTARDGRALFNLPGPDLSAADLAEALDGAGERPLAVVNTAPASAPFAPVLARPGRVVITATARSAENDHTRFAGHFVAAYGGRAADADRDGRVSLLEAFHYAARETAREYSGRQQIATEHAVLEDDGDGRGSREPAADGDGDGFAAARFHLAAVAAPGTASPRMLALEREARDLVTRIAALRRQRAALSPEGYLAALEELLVSLALNRRALREVVP